MNKDFGLTVAASILTSVGLEQNHLTQMIGGMIISPLANPIMRAIMVDNYVKNIVMLMVMILTCVVVGMLYFMIQGGDPFQITERMLSIADPSGRDYISDAIYGLISGMVIYGSYGLYRPDDINILAGLAVGVTVLPAFVNAGIMFGAGLKGYKNRYKKNMTYYGMTSMFVGFIYLATITLGILTAKIVNEEYIKLTKKD